MIRGKIKYCIYFSNVYSLKVYFKANVSTLFVVRLNSIFFSDTVHLDFFIPEASLRFDRKKDSKISSFDGRFLGWCLVHY